MARFIFIKKPSFVGDETTVKLSIQSGSMIEVLEAFEDFLKGSGFFLPKGASIGYEYADEESGSTEE